MTFDFWNKPDGEFVFRFLEDQDASNPRFWRRQARQARTLPLSIPPCYVRRYTYFMQGFVVSAPDHERNDYIYKFRIHQYLAEDIKRDLGSDRMEYYAVDVDHGYDFKMIKSKVLRGPDVFRHYVGEWLYPSRPLTMSERVAIDHQGLTDLKTWVVPTMQHGLAAIV